MHDRLAFAKDKSRRWLIGAAIGAPVGLTLAIAPLFLRGNMATPPPRVSANVLDRDGNIITDAFGNTIYAFVPEDMTSR